MILKLSHFYSSENVINKYPHCDFVQWMDCFCEKEVTSGFKKKLFWIILYFVENFLLNLLVALMMEKLFRIKAMCVTLMNHITAPKT